jgi:bifunctional DNase/RNase
MKQHMHQYQVRGLALHEATRSPFLVLEDVAEGDTITIQIGPSEAGTLLLTITDTIPAVPQPDDVLADLFEQHHFQAEYITIQNLGSPRSYAVLHYRSIMKKHYQTNLQPAYGIALALRFDIPIFLSPEAIVTGTINNPLFDFNRNTSEQFLYISNS